MLNTATPAPPPFKQPAFNFWPARLRLGKKTLLMSGGMDLTQQMASAWGSMYGWTPEGQTQATEYPDEEMIPETDYLWPSTQPRYPRDRAGLGTYCPGAEPKDMMHLLRFTTKALINHEDAVNLTRMDRGFVLFLGTQGNTVLPALIALSGKWNQEGGFVHGKRVPLRAILAQSFFAELKQRLTAVGSDPSRLTEQQRTALLSDGEWIMMKWCSDRAEMIADPSRPSMSLATTLQLVDCICQAVTNPETVLKFNAKPPGLTAAPKNGCITMLLEISQRFPHSSRQ